MSDDMDGKLHDLEPQGEGEEEEEEGDDNEIDKQMGDVDEQGGDKLDEQMWGSDEEEEQEQDKEVISPYYLKQLIDKLDDEIYSCWEIYCFNNERFGWKG